MMLLLVALIFLQPDLATAGVLVSMWLAMVFESDMPVRYMLITVFLGLVGLYPMWRLTELLGFGYVHDRVLGFFSPGTDYQVGQALIAIGSGGFWGKGLGQGTQSQLRYLPARHTDFIFAVAAEELGFAGIMLLFVLYAVLFWRLLRIILIASDTYGRLLATGVLAMILFQFIINIGMNLGILPVAGLPLPFVSYGATALMTTLVGIGIAENVVMRHKRFEF
jgi:rod shape determining protein RodA